MSLYFFSSSLSAAGEATATTVAYVTTATVTTTSMLCTPEEVGGRLVESGVMTSWTTRQITRFCVVAIEA